MSITEFAVHNNSTLEVQFFDHLNQSIDEAKKLASASVYTYYDGGLRIRHSYEVKNKRAYRINKVI